MKSKLIKALVRMTETSLGQSIGMKTILLVILSLLYTQMVFGQYLRIATMNCWSGLDYYGTWKVGEYETVEIREKRFQILLTELRDQHIDIVALQEVNPIDRFTQRIADSLDYDCIYERVNSGIKIGNVGIPSNLNEGIAVLAKKDLRLKLVDIWRLSNQFGALGNILSFHFAEFNIALVCKVVVADRTMYIVNCHLSAHVPQDSLTSLRLEKNIHERCMTTQEASKDFTSFNNVGMERERQVRILLDDLHKLPSNSIVVVLGDFNSTANSREIQLLKSEGNMLDAQEIAGNGKTMTWDPERNTNIAFSCATSYLKDRIASPLELLSAWYDHIPRRIDYVLLNSKFQKEDVQSAGVILDVPHNGLFASDHFGVAATVSIKNAIGNVQPELENQITRGNPEIEPLPILSYDTDVGFGYGAKAFFLNQLGGNESFDVVVFNSSKGERWYRFVFSLPDFELRQGKIYPWALDFVVDYDKWITNSFFGIGNHSSYKNRESYTREPLEVNLIVNRGFSKTTVGQIGLKYKSVRNYNFENTSRLKFLPPALDSSKAYYTSLFINYRYDTRNSFINPSDGIVFQSELEYAPQKILANVNLLRASGWFQYYTVLFYPKTVFAFRLGLTGLNGSDVPVQVLQSIGGNLTLRGSPQDRYLDKSDAILNAEFRFPIVWRFGGIAGFDAGKVWSGLNRIDLYNWVWNEVIGLRLYMDTFVVRADIGFGRETTGFYLNFGQLF